MIREPSIQRTADGLFRVDIPADQRDVLRGLPRQLGELLDEGEPERDPAVRRLFPTADLDDAEHAEEFDRLVRSDLLAQRNDSIATMQRTIDADSLTEEELTSWLGVVNDLRLVLGTRLDVTEETSADDIDERDPRAASFGLYAYLSYLEETIVRALSDG